MRSIMLLMKHQKNQELLEKFLSTKYEVVVLENNEALYDYDKDLIIVDYKYFLNHRAEILEIKENEKPLFLPILLLLSSEETSYVSNSLLDEVDEFIDIPIKKQELEIRIRNLLRIRSYSIESEERYNILSKNSNAGICILHEGKIVYSNLALARILKRDNEELQNKPLLELIPNSNSNSNPYPQEIIQIIHEPGLLSHSGEQQSFEIKTSTPSGEKWLSMRFLNISYQGNLTVMAIITDITERKKQEEKIWRLSYQDVLTGLYNRAFLEEEIKRIDNNRYKLPISVLIADINGLKLVNDAFGHQVGDKMLICAANLLKNVCGEDNFLFRWGGDEYVMIFPETNSEGAEDIVEKIKKESSKWTIESVPVKFALGNATKKIADESFASIFKRAEDDMYKNKLYENENVKRDIINALLANLKEKSDETEKHAMRMTNISFGFGEKLQLSETELERLSLIATLHDIGKVVIPEKVLKKPGKLNEDEWRLIKEHPEVGWRITRSSENLAYVAEDILSHHERWDGKGYPKGIGGKDIPILARIIAIIDAYDVMTNGRSYKNSISKAMALDEIERCAGTQFDPGLAEAFVKMMKEDMNGGNEVRALL